ncbi:MAG: zinc ribbon domain-containing protein [Anaerolineales bacterium]
MPVYVYQCENCGVQFEKQQSFSDHPLVRCPECGKKALKKVYQPVGIVFKGSGFYATDHHSPSGQSSKKADEKAESESKTSTVSKETAAKGEKVPEKNPEKSLEKSSEKATEKKE